VVEGNWRRTRRELLWLFWRSALKGRGCWGCPTTVSLGCKGRRGRGEEGGWRYREGLSRLAGGAVCFVHGGHTDKSGSSCFDPSKRARFCSRDKIAQKNFYVQNGFLKHISNIFDKEKYAKLTTSFFISFFSAAFADFCM
jgi:hypothetical protein